jgi:hypothetical protein
MQVVRWTGPRLVQEDDEGISDIPSTLGITMFPAVVFFKNKKVVWRKQGSHGMKGELAEGVLALGGKQYVTSASVAELESERDFDAFVKAKSANAQHLKVVMMSSYMCSPCVHAYPYFVALSASFIDFEFARHVPPVHLFACTVNSDSDHATAPWIRQCAWLVQAGR